jgi:hypothetical protein
VNHTLALSLLTVAALPAMTACSNAPTRASASASASASVAAAPAPALAALDCAALAHQRQGLQQAHHDALERQQHAWQAVIPFAVAARYGSARSAASKAEEQLAALDAASARQGCQPQG